MSSKVNLGTRLQQLYEMTQELLFHISLEDELLQSGIDNVTRLLDAKYGAIGILDEHGNLAKFIYTGLTPEERQRLDHLPEGKGILGALLQEGEPLRLSDLTQDPRSVGFPSGHPFMRSFLGVPIISQNRVLGRIYLTEKAGGKPFSAEDEWLLMAFSATLASSIETTRIYQQLQRSEATYRSLVETSSDIIFRADPRGLITYINDAWRNLSGYTVAETIGQPLSDFVPPEDRTSLVEMVEKILKGSPIQYYRLRLQTKQGDFRIGRLNATLFKDEGGEWIHIQGIIRDITELEKMEAQLLQNSKLASLGELAAGIAHEINNPITGIIQAAELAMDDISEGTTARDLLQMAVNESNRIAQIVRNLLTFARQERQEHSPAHIVDILNASLSFFERQLEKDGITVIKEYEQPFPRIKCRSQQIQQVLINLISNARYALNAKYHGYHDGKVLKISSSIATRDEKEYVRVSVHDNGTGIAQEHLGKIFDPFFTTKREEQGTGLGLSVSYGIVKDHGGEINVESQPGVSTTFFVDLPVENGWKFP